MNKWILLSWSIFLIFLGSIFYLSHHVPEKSDDSIVRQYRISVNENALISARDERTKQEPSKVQVEATATTPEVKAATPDEAITINKVQQ